jgi:hypothetical protein
MYLASAQPMHRVRLALFGVRGLIKVWNNFIFARLKNSFARARSAVRRSMSCSFPIEGTAGVPAVGRLSAATWVVFSNRVLPISHSLI